eukprot:s2235_g2.t1
MRKAPRFVTTATPAQKQLVWADTDDMQLAPSSYISFMLFSRSKPLTRIQPNLVQLGVLAKCEFGTWHRLAAWLRKEPTAELCEGRQLRLACRLALSSRLTGSLAGNLVEVNM